MISKKNGTVKHNSHKKRGSFEFPEPTLRKACLSSTNIYVSTSNSTAFSVTETLALIQ